VTQQTSNSKKYLFYVTLSYSYSVLRPIEMLLKNKRYEVAWFIPKGSEAEKFIEEGDVVFNDAKQAIAYESDAVLAPGNYIPDFIPGIKVQVFHGFDSGKKNKFNIRGFFDLYCTQGPNITEAFRTINDGTCEIKETGWSKLDPLFTVHPDKHLYISQKPVILYAPTFSPKLTSTYALAEYIKTLSMTKDWQWLIKLHPKATQDEIEMFKAMSNENLKFVETSNIIPLLQAADVLLSDTSSILAEFALQKKPVVSYHNRQPASWLINFTESDKLEEKLEFALNRCPDVLDRVVKHCDAIHPYRDGQSSARMIAAIDELIDSGIGHLKSKPLNLIRRLKIRKKLKYYRWK
jgi:CDP-glycerol glycerophosphotransferase (TagB/SpsB family)